MKEENNELRDWFLNEIAKIDITGNKQNQNVKWQDKWQKLKEWLEEKKSRNERRLKEAPVNTEFYIRVSVQGITINKILTIMQELEGEDVED